MSGKTEYMSNMPHRSLEMDGRLEIDQEIARKKNNRQQEREREEQEENARDGGYGVAGREWRLTVRDD